MWTFEIYEDGGGEYRWRLVAGNGRTVGDSGEGYDSRSGAHRAAERAKQEIGSARLVDE